MKSIGNIYLAWRKDANSPRILVGVIKQNATAGVRFFYLAEGAIAARKHGFEAYECFPDVTEVYTENVLSFFGFRILKAAKDGFENSEAYFDAWGINRAFKSKPFYMLAYTQGILPTDNFEFLADFNPRKDFSLVTEIDDFQFSVIAAIDLQVGDTLKYQMTKGSEQVKLYKDQRYVGKVKIVHSRVFAKAKNLTVKIHRIEQGEEAANKAFIRIFR